MTTDVLIQVTDLQKHFKGGKQNQDEKIRALDRPDSETVPIFAMTANAFSDDAARSRKAGMNEHLTKPLDLEKITKAVRKYCKKNSR